MPLRAAHSALGVPAAGITVRIQHVPWPAARGSSIQVGRRSRATDCASCMGSPVKPVASGLQNGPWTASPSDHCPAVPTSPARPGLGSSCSSTPSLERLLAPRKRLICRLWGKPTSAWHCLVKGTLLQTGAGFEPSS